MTFPRTALFVIACANLGCAMRGGMNLDCAWPPESVWALDLGNRDDARHLVDDVRVAEELGIRYADRLAGKRPVSVLGIQVRTGMRGPSSGVERERCYDSLFATIAANHHVRREDVLTARGRLGEKGADLAVNLPMSALLLLLAVASISQVHVGLAPMKERLPSSRLSSCRLLQAS